MTTIRLHNDNMSICSLIVIHDNRIATGGFNGSIAISSYKLNEKKWNRIEISSKKKHTLVIYVLFVY